MGIARLLAKGWVVFCLFAGAHAVRLAAIHGEIPQDSFSDIVVPLFLFTAMGLVFIAGYGAAGLSARALRARFKPGRLAPGFDDLVFVVFVLASFINQVLLAPAVMDSPVANAISVTVSALVPGQRALEDQLSCGLDGGRVFSSAFAWILALVYFGSAASRLRLTAGILRLERVTFPEPLGPMPLALVLGAFAIVGIQLLF